MTVLSDRDIKRVLESKKLVIEGLDWNFIDAAKVDLHLGNQFRVFKHSEITHIDTRIGLAEDLMDLIEVPKDKPFVIHPGELVLGVTKEYIKMPNDLVGRLDGRSSLGRLGIVVHSTAGSIDPGFEGNITLEITNLSRLPVCLWPNTRVCRLTFDQLSSPSEKPYNKTNSKYLKQTGPEASRIGSDKE